MSARHRKPIRRSIKTAAVAAMVVLGALGPALAAPAAAAAALPLGTISAEGRTMGQTMSYNSGFVGQCTWGAMNFWHAAEGYYPDIQGNAMAWPVDAMRHGWTVVPYPEPRSIVVFQPGVYLASPFFGHAGWVDWVENRPDGRYIHGRQVDGPSPTFVFKSIPGMSYILAP